MEGGMRLLVAEVIDDVITEGGVNGVAKALKADPSDGRPLGKLRDFAKTDDASTTKDDVGPWLTTEGTAWGGDVTGAGSPWDDDVVVEAGLCIGDAGTGLKICMCPAFLVLFDAGGGGSKGIPPELEPGGGGILKMGS